MANENNVVENDRPHNRCVTMVIKITIGCLPPNSVGLKQEEVYNHHDLNKVERIYGSLTQRGVEMLKQAIEEDSTELILFHEEACSCQVGD